MNVNNELLSNIPVYSIPAKAGFQHFVSEHAGAIAGFDDVFVKMKSVNVSSADEIVKYRDNGDRYYIIKEGNAEVWKPDPETDIWSCVARLGPGDAFGEEAILVGGFRNATVRMVTSGVLLVLQEDVFNSDFRSRLVKEITPEQAYVMSRHENTEWLDCRFDVENQEVRIPNSRLVPLHILRESVHELDADVNYLVYCRSGRRSICATYLLRERGFNAFSVMGGVRDWPYALEHGK